MTVAYRYYWNANEDEKGRFTTFFGFNPGDKLQVAYEGEIPSGSDSEEALEKLFVKFNSPYERPDDYRGPSMSVGSVVTLGFPDTGEAVSYSVSNFGFKVADISKCEIVSTDPRWIAPKVSKNEMS